MVENLLDYSVPLDINLTISNDLAEQVYEATDIGGYKKSRIPQLQVLLANIISNHKTDADLYIAVSQDNSAYKPKSRYNSLSIGKSFVSLLKTMSDHGWLELHRGFLDRNTGISRRSRIKATQKLITLLEKLEALSSLLAYAPSTECIILRDENKQEKEYKDTDLKQIDLDRKPIDASDLRRNLTAYNNLLHKTAIDHPTFPDAGVVMKDDRIFRINPSDKFVRRIYNRSSFEWNGRFYGGWWQRIPKEYRKGIKLDGWPTTELDFSAFHMVLLYSLSGIDYWKEIGTDPYLLEDYVVSSEQIRSLLKIVVLIAVNAESRTQALNAIRHEINTANRDEFRWFRQGNYDLEHILDLFIEKHRPIEDRFFNPDELSVANIDSDIAEYVINEFTKKNMAILSIHDSFIVPFVMENGLRYTMQKACESVSELRLGTAIKKTNISFEFGAVKDFKIPNRTIMDAENELNIIMNDRNSDVFNIQDFDEHKKIVSRHLSLVGTDDQYV